MGWLSNSTFNQGMAAFLVCLSELCREAMNYDRALRLPYNINPSRSEMIHNGVGEYKVDWKHGGEVDDGMQVYVDRLETLVGMEHKDMASLRRRSVLWW